MACASLPTMTLDVKQLVAQNHQQLRAQIPATVKHIVFDLDHTLWDYDRNAGLTLTNLWQTHGLAIHGGSAADFVTGYHAANTQVWHQYSSGIISKHELRATRFRLLEQELGWPAFSIPETLALAFLQECPEQPHLLAGVPAALQNLAQYYQLHLLTNGFSDSQFRKVRASGLDQWLSEVICSDHTHAPKPHKQAFQFVERKLAAQPAELLMIGDNAVADVGGAKAAGWFAWHYHYAGEPATMADLVFADWQLLKE